MAPSPVYERVHLHTRHSVQHFRIKFVAEIFNLEKFKSATLTLSDDALFHSQILRKSETAAGTRQHVADVRDFAGARGVVTGMLRTCAANCGDWRLVTMASTSARSMDSRLASGLTRSASFSKRRIKTRRRQKSPSTSPSSGTHACAGRSSRISTPAGPDSDQRRGRRSKCYGQVGASPGFEVRQRAPGPET